MISIADSLISIDIQIKTFIDSNQSYNKDNHKLGISKKIIFIYNTSYIIISDIHN